MAGFRDNDYISLIVRLFVGGLFIYAAIDKIIYPDQFARIVYNYHLLPGELVNLTALVLPWVEMICGVFLIIGFNKNGSALLLNILTVVFIFAIGINVYRGVSLECGCFTVGSNARGDALDLLYRDIGLLALTLYIYFNRSRKFLLSKS